MCWLIKKWTRGCNAYRLLTGTNCVILFLGLVSEGGRNGSYSKSGCLDKVTGAHP